MLVRSLKKKSPGWTLEVPGYGIRGVSITTWRKQGIALSSDEELILLPPSRGGPQNPKRVKQSEQKYI